MARLLCCILLSLSAHRWTTDAAPPLSSFGIGYHVGHASKIEGDFQSIRQHFGGVRTFLTHVNPQVNIIDVAATVGLKIATGIPVDSSRFELDLTAVVAGAKRNPSAVQAVYVGNEDLLQGFDAGRLVGLIQQVKRRLVDAGLPSIPVGTVQTDGSFLEFPYVTDVCDVMGVNIHPFFSHGQPMANFEARWRNMKAKFPASKLRMTETGWPTAGGYSPTGQDANEATSSAFFKAFYSWHQKEQSDMPFWFMYQDVPSKGGFETYFGLSRVDGSWKIDWQSYGSPPSAPPVRPTSAMAVESPDGYRLAVVNGQLKSLQQQESALFIWDLATNGLRTNGNNCLVASAAATDVRLEPCDPKSSNQRWLVHRRANRLTHVGDGMCMDIAPPERKPQLAPCDGGNDNQMIRMVSLQLRCTLEKNVDYAGNDLKAVATPDAAACCKVCRDTAKCNAFSWMRGTCWLKHTKGPKSSKDGVVSAAFG
ncbi:hypothetical protein DYB26_006255 [Aphanomyces astaci]|uniref:glucan endo-1,3-beta-D-glucosidase n=1 Tax=Aphanomyces astaci TaxID=112090 RepID=A0A418EMF9_APHAT|nr:hypothetical protein DYB26_006255 [Aphanomyces astaci]